MQNAHLLEKRKEWEGEESSSKNPCWTPLLENNNVLGKRKNSEGEEPAAKRHNNIMEKFNNLMEKVTLPLEWQNTAFHNPHISLEERVMHLENGISEINKNFPPEIIAAFGGASNIAILPRSNVILTKDQFQQPLYWVQGNGKTGFQWRMDRENSEMQERSISVTNLFRNADDVSDLENWHREVHLSRQHASGRLEQKSIFHEDLNIFLTFFGVWIQTWIQNKPAQEANKMHI